jgi:cholest-4-en-3-one 26-monooxygenase
MSGRTSQADPSTFDVLSNVAYSEGVPYELFRRLRAERPIHYQDVPDPRLLGPAWVLTTHAHVLEASTMAAIMGNRHGLNLRATYSDDEPRHLLNIDGHEHVRQRRMTNTHFSPRAIRRYTDHYHDLAGRLIDTATAKSHGEFDLVDEVSVPLPLVAICELMGDQPDDVDQIVRWSNAIITNDDPELSESEEYRTENMVEMMGYIAEMFARRRSAPGDDLATVLTHEVDSGALTNDDALAYAMLLFVAGNETTRNNISHGLLQLARHPDQWKALVDAVRTDPVGARRAYVAGTEPEHLIDTAVEEITRWASPVIYMKRTAYEDVDFHGVTFKKGDHVVLHYASANRDETVFGDNAEQFDISRWPNPHLAFGFGPHICMGSHLARLETRALLIELAERATRLELTGEPDYGRSSFVHTIKHLPIRIAA